MKGARGSRTGAAAAAVHVLMLLAALAGCGKESAVGSGGAGDPSPQKAETRLTIRVTSGGDVPAHEWTLTCDPVGGDHPAAKAACAALAGTADPFKPVPPDAICPQIYGGPQTATIEGVWRGEHVSASYNRKNGCEIHRWEAIKVVLQPRDVPASASPEDR